MKQLLTSLAFLILASTSMAQPGSTGHQQATPPPGQMHLAGTITSGDEMTPYIMNIVQHPDGTLTGYTLTVWRSGVLKADLVGTEDANGNLDFKEIPAQGYGQYYYYFSAKLQRSERNDGVHYEGSYASANPGGDAGTAGNMMLTSFGTAADDPAPGDVISDQVGDDIRIIREYNPGTTVIEQTIVPPPPVIHSIPETDLRIEDVMTVDPQPPVEELVVESQLSEQIHLQGNIVDKAGSHPYIVNMEVLPDGTIRGYSLTIWPSSVLQAVISGSRDKDGSLVLKETPDPREPASPTAYYFTDYLSPSTKGNINSYSGFYTSAKMSGVSHEGGTLTLTVGGSVQDDPAPTNIGETVDREFLIKEEDQTTNWFPPLKTGENYTAPDKE